MQAIREFYDHGIEYETRLSGEKGSILRFNLDYVLALGWILPRRGSIFNMTEILIIMLVVIGVATLLGYSTCDHADANQHTCIVLPSPSTSYLTLITLCSFVIAFFANTVMSRWWSVRTALQAVMGASQELVMSVVGVSESAMLLTPAENRTELILRYDELIKQLSGHCLLVMSQLFNNARDQRPIGELIEKDLLSNADLAVITHINNGKANPFHVCCQLTNAIHRAANANLLGSCPETKRVMLQQMLESLKSLRSNASAITMYADVQLPYPFIQIVTAVVYAFSIQLIIVCASFISSGSVKSNGDLVTGYLTLITYVFVLLGMLRLYGVLENPLGHDAADFPGDTYYTMLKNNLYNARKDAINHLQQLVAQDGVAVGMTAIYGDTRADGTANGGRGGPIADQANPLYYPPKPPRDIHEKC